MAFCFALKVSKTNGSLNSDSEGLILFSVCGAFGLLILSQNIGVYHCILLLSGRVLPLPFPHSRWAVVVGHGLLILSVFKSLAGSFPRHDLLFPVWLEVRSPSWFPRKIGE